MSVAMKLKPMRLLLLGAPGAGKGTQTSRVLTKFPMIHSISSGDLLRSNIANKTTIGLECSDIIKSGGLVPDDTMISLISSELSHKKWLNSSTSWLLDGFPRTLSQAEALEEVLKPHEASLNLVVELQVPEQVILERIENRWVHVPSGRVYNLTYNPPKVPGKDDITGESLSKRPDDNPDTYKQRLDRYRKEIDPLLGFYSKRNLLVSIQGETSDIIAPKIEQLLLGKFS